MLYTAVPAPAGSIGKVTGTGYSPETVTAQPFCETVIVFDGGAHSAGNPGATETVYVPATERHIGLVDVWQSAAQLAGVSPGSHKWFPHTAWVDVWQSAAQLAGVSPDSHMWFPHTGVVLVGRQSRAHDAAVSPVSHSPFPHVAGIADPHRAQAPTACPESLTQDSPLAQLLSLVHPGEHINILWLQYCPAGQVPPATMAH